MNVADIAPVIAPEGGHLRFLSVSFVTVHSDAASAKIFRWA